MRREPSGLRFRKRLCLGRGIWLNSEEGVVGGGAGKAQDRRENIAFVTRHSFSPLSNARDKEPLRPLFPYADNCCH